MTKKRSISLILLAIMLIFSCFVIVGCGKPATLQEYIESDSDLKEEIDDMGGSKGVEVTCKDNNLTFEYKLSSEVSSSMMKYYKASFKKSMSSYTSTFTNVAKKLEEETEIDGIKVIVTYRDKSGDKIYSATFDDAGLVK